MTGSDKSAVDSKKLDNHSASSRMGRLPPLPRHADSNKLDNPSSSSLTRQQLLQLLPPIRPHVNTQKQQTTPSRINITAQRTSTAQPSTASQSSSTRNAARRGCVEAAHIEQMDIGNCWFAAAFNGIFIGRVGQYMVRFAIV